MKQFAKALSKEGKSFEHLSNTWPGIIIKKKENGIFPDIRKLVKDPHFIESINDVELRAWTSFKSVIQNFLGNRKASNYGQLLDEL